MNLNKLFPRLPIRVKLAIAFVLIAGMPLVLVAGFAARVQVEHLRSTAESSLDHELEIARTLVDEALREAEENVAYLASSLLGPALEDPTPMRLTEVGRRAAAFLEHKRSIYQVSLIDADGTLLLMARATGSETIFDDLPENGQPSGMLYAYRARYLEPGGHLLLPVELKGRGRGASAPIPAVAVVKPFWDAAGRFRGAMAGEVHASALFAGLDSEPVHLPGLTGLVDGEGLFLFHSEHKRDWASLLASRDEVDLSSEFSPELAARILSGEVGTTTAEGRLVSFSPLSLGRYDGTAPLIVYRAIPVAALEGPIRGFMWWVGAAGLGLGTVMLTLAVVAANQFTRPIYRLREGMRRLAEGADSPGRLGIETNDELEDLAGEFTEMAAALSTYRHRLEELVADRTRALHETYAELANVLAHSADAIIGLDADGRVRVWNRGAETLFGYAREEAVGRDLNTLIHLRGRKAEHEGAFLRRKLEEAGAVVDFRTRRARKDGDLIAVSLTQSVIRDEHGKPLGYSLILRDASAQAKLEDQMRRSERLAAVSLMATALAHEVNNPLAIIATRIEVMKREVRSRCPDCDLDDDLSVLWEHTTRLGDVTRALLDLTSDEDEATGKVVLPDVAERVARLTEQLFSARDIQLEVRAPEGAVPELQGNEKALETVCLNLLLNAADATPQGGTVVLETRAAPDRSEVELEVRDTGAGVARELRDRIFEPFFTTKGAVGGTGLGLAVCRSVVERHGGRIRLDSEPGAGSRFIVTLPVLGSVGP